MDAAGRPSPARRKFRPGVLIAVAVFLLLGAIPVIRSKLHLAYPAAVPASSDGVHLLPAPRSLAPVRLPRVAQPIQAGDPPAVLSAASPTLEAAAVSAEDARLRILLHSSARIFQPQVVSLRGALPTLVLPPGPATYTAADLVAYGALILLPKHTGLLVDSIFVAGNARLTLGTPDLRALYLDSSATGFASVVSWGGTLGFQGTAAHPLTIMGWDRQTHSPASDAGYGRAYIRAVGGHLTLTDVRATSLGFWSGRTGGVAWTGVNGQAASGGATGSTFTDDTYGAFVERGRGVRFTGDLFEFNQLDGLHIHRYTTGATVADSSAVRNGGNGFVVDPATQGTVLKDDVADHNAGNGYLLDGQPLVSGASASGNSVLPGSGTQVSGSSAIGNLKTGILIEGGTGTVLAADEVCNRGTGIAVRDGAAGTVVTGSDVRCGERNGLEVGPNASGTLVVGDHIVGARNAMLVRNAGRLETDNNVITGATVFGITVRGSLSRVSGQGNVISGTGFRPVDARADASTPKLSGTNTAGWIHHVRITFVSYLEFHPLAATWLGIVTVVLAMALWSRLFRRAPMTHPYPVSTRWRPVAASDPPEYRPAALSAVGAPAAGPAPPDAGPAPGWREQPPAGRHAAGADWQRGRAGTLAHGGPDDITGQLPEVG
jgi:Right handed beta helix region